MNPVKKKRSGANKLLDALSLAREIYKGCKPVSQWKEVEYEKSTY
jgi:hypothetical protein